MRFFVSFCHEIGAGKAQRTVFGNSEVSLAAIDGINAVNNIARSIQKKLNASGPVTVLFFTPLEEHGRIFTR